MAFQSFNYGARRTHPLSSSLEAGASPHTSRYTSFGDLTRVREIPGGDGGTGSVRGCGVWWKVEVGTIKRESEEDGERIDTPRHLVAHARSFRWPALGRRGWDESVFDWYALRTTVCVVHAVDEMDTYMNNDAPKSWIRSPMALLNPNTPRSLRLNLLLPPHGHLVAGHNVPAAVAVWLQETMDLYTFTDLAERK
ncbi:hypothetical protein C8J57DRAFT_1507749 [Mycena rebaudengoi]|nr:hypothetical protein C8J57DRAFT_1507749 [Mycena rebaudengoi]